MNKIQNLTEEDVDDAIEPSFYDENIEHIKLVVEDIFKNWKNRSCEGKYNGILTTHVGGGKASTPMAMMYFREFHRVNNVAGYIEDVTSRLNKTVKDKNYLDLVIVVDQLLTGLMHRN